MSTKQKETHIERTSNEPRGQALHTVTLEEVDEINESIRIFRLVIPEKGTIRFLPGQWLDVYLPGIATPGGFTITSPPSSARPNGKKQGFLELAVKKVAADPAAQWQWLWQTPATKIIGSELQVRVGGSFVWPPPGVMVSTLRKVVFVAGGVGVNPLVSMLRHLGEGRAGLGPNAEVHFFYSMKDPGEGKRDAARMLFLDRIDRVFAQGKVRGRLHLFLTTENGEADTREVHCARGKITFEAMRIKTEDVASVIGHDKRFSVVYVCGVPTMTDDFVEKLTSRSELGLEPHRVLFEKWW